MKGTILMIALLFTSIFAGVFVMADEENGETVDVEDVEVEGIESEDIESTIDEIAAPNNYKKVGFVRLSTFNGWAENGEVGSLIHGFWAVQRFADIDGDSSDVEVKTVRALGKLHISGYGDYKLARIRDNGEDNDTISFYLIPLRNERSYESETTLAQDSIGTLEVTKENEFGKLVTWNGELTLNEGEYAGTYDVELGSITKTIKPTGLAGEGKKAGFWNRFQFWKRNNPGNESNGNQASTQGVQNGVRQGNLRSTNPQAANTAN